MEDSPFPELKISCSDCLDEVESRQPCPQCNKSRRFFCYTCFKVLPSVADKIPVIKLPFAVHIIKHPYEVDGKSTAAHAAVLAPTDVTVFQFPDIPDYSNSRNTVLVFPGSNSISLEQFIEEMKDTIESVSDKSAREICSSDGLQPEMQTIINTVVFIDCTWYQVYKIATDPRLGGLQRIEITSHNTKFWRHQHDRPPTYLSTIEAIYYCAREYHELCSQYGLRTDQYDGQYDDLLYLFVYFYRKIHDLTVTTGKRLKAYHLQHQDKKKRPIKF